MLISCVFSLEMDLHSCPLLKYPLQGYLKGQLWGKVTVTYLICLLCVASFLVYLIHWGTIRRQAYWGTLPSSLRAIEEPRYSRQADGRSSLTCLELMGAEPTDAFLLVPCFQLYLIHSSTTVLFEFQGKVSKLRAELFVYFYCPKFLRTFLKIRD